MCTCVCGIIVKFIVTNGKTAHLEMFNSSEYQIALNLNRKTLKCASHGDHHSVI